MDPVRLKHDSFTETITRKDVKLNLQFSWDDSLRGFQPYLAELALASFPEA